MSETDITDVVVAEPAPDPTEVESHPVAELVPDDMHPSELHGPGPDGFPY